MYLKKEPSSAPNVTPMLGAQGIRHNSKLDNGYEGQPDRCKPVSDQGVVQGFFQGLRLVSSNKYCAPIGWIKKLCIPTLPYPWVPLTDKQKG